MSKKTCSKSNMDTLDHIRVKLFTIIIEIYPLMEQLALQSLMDEEELHLSSMSLAPMNDSNLLAFKGKTRKNAPPCLIWYAAVKDESSDNRRYLWQHVPRDYQLAYSKTTLRKLSKGNNELEKCWKVEQLAAEFRKTISLIKSFMKNIDNVEMFMKNIDLLDESENSNFSQKQLLKRWF